MPTDLCQEGKILRRNGEFCQRLNGLKTRKLCDLDFIRTKCHRRLGSEGPARQEIDGTRSPGLTRESRLADGEHVVRAVKRTRLVGEAHTRIRNRRNTLAIDDGKEHRPQAIRSGINGFLIAKFVEVSGLARLEQGNVGIRGSMQGNIVMIGEIAQELPAGLGQCELNRGAPAHVDRRLEQLIKRALRLFVEVPTRSCQPVIR